MTKEEIYEAVRTELAPMLSMSTSQLVPKACDALVRHGLMPASWNELLLIIGKGSASTLHNELKKWRSNSLSKLTTPTFAGLPEDPVLQDAARNFFEVFANHSRKIAASAWQEERDTLEANLNQADLALATASEKIAALESDIKETNAALLLLQTQNEGLEKQIAGHHATIDQLEKQVSEWKARAESLQTHCDQQVAAKDAQLALKDTEIQKALADIKEVRNWTVTQIEQARSQAEKARAQANSLLSSYEKQTETNQRLNEELKIVIEQRDALKLAHASANSSIRELEKLVAELRQQNKKLDADNKAIARDRNKWRGIAKAKPIDN